MNSWIVSKFGGSSVKDGHAMLCCSQIVENNPKIKITILSATYNTTNQLEMVARASESGDLEMLNKVISELEHKHRAIASELFSSQLVHDELSKLFDELKNLSNDIIKAQTYSSEIMDQIYSLGERMSSLIFADLLKLRMPDCNVIFFDARKVIKTNSEFRAAEPQIEIIASCAKKEILPLLADPKTIIVTQGFIGEDLTGKTTTLGREGSDYSAALMAEAIDAELIQIWTDVDGVASCDPRLIPDAKFISEMSYDEATALATLGAKVLFPRTLLPAKRKNIPVFVGASTRPLSPGTLIKNYSDTTFKLKAVTLQNIKNENYLSFVGSNLEKTENLVEKILDKMGDQKVHFVFVDYTHVSITFKVVNLDKLVALKLAHQILLN